MVPWQVQKTGKTISVSSKINVFDILEKQVLGMALDHVLESFWHQVGARVASKVDFGGFENEFKKHEKKVTQGKMRQAGGGGSPLIEQYKQPDCRQLTTDARLADGRHFRPCRHSTAGLGGTVAD